MSTARSVMPLDPVAEIKPIDAAGAVPSANEPSAVSTARSLMPLDPVAEMKPTAAVVAVADANNFQVMLRTVDSTDTHNAFARDPADTDNDMKSSMMTNDDEVFEKTTSSNCCGSEETAKTR